jgi:hypothetical protein
MWPVRDKCPLSGGGVTIRIITCYSPYSPYPHPLVPALDFFLASCNPFFLALLYRSLLVYIKLLPLVTLAFFFNLESSLINGILPTEPYLLVAFYLKGRDRGLIAKGGL